MSHPRVVARVSWRGLWHPGMESAVLSALESGWRLSGHADVQYPEGPLAFRYRIDCNRRWEPTTAELVLRSESERRRVEISRDARNEWTVSGFRNTGLRGCTDLDLAASPSTNTFALNRLALAIGEAAEILTAWVMFPDATPVAVKQRYTRLSEHRYLFEGLHNRFSREFEVDDRGLVTSYPESWERVRVARGRSRPATSPRRAAGSRGRRT